jgi:hypothetical protein
MSLKEQILTKENEFLNPRPGHSHIRGKQGDTKRPFFKFFEFPMQSPLNWQLSFSFCFVGASGDSWWLENSCKKAVHQRGELGMLRS